ncbi:MAG: PorV/PorQ family protein [Elusimicrobiota bacterium]
MIAAVLSVLLLPSGYAWSAGVGTTGADFLNVGVGARQLGMGSAFMGVDTDPDANAINWNPAALALIQKKDVTVSYNSLFMDENQGFVGYAQPLSGGSGVVAGGLNYLNIANIQARAGDTENANSTFNNDNYALSGSYARTLGQNLSVGANVKFIHEQFFDYSQSAEALDLGALYKTPIKDLTAGAALRNLGTDIGPDQLPLTADGGLSYKLLKERLTLASDVDWLALDKTAYISLGAEYWINEILALRAGYQFGHGADQLQSELTGMGIGMGFKTHGFDLDYAFLPYGSLGDTHRVTMGWKF